MGDASLEAHRIEPRQTRGFAFGGNIAALAMLDHFGCPTQAADGGNAGDVATIPFHAELEILVRIEPAGIDSELSHRRSPLISPVHTPIGRQPRCKSVQAVETNVDQHRRTG
jgi:hypothetical protein